MSVSSLTLRRCYACYWSDGLAGAGQSERQHGPHPRRTQRPRSHREGPAGIAKVVDEWVRVYEKRGREDGIEYVQIFEVRLPFICILRSEM